MRNPPPAEAAADAARAAADTRRVLANTAYRAAADIGSKIVSVVFFVVMARTLGDDGFGVFTFGLAVAAIVTVLGGFGQDLVLVREVARDHGRLPAYFANTNGLKLTLSVPALGVAVGVVALVGADDAKVTVVALLGLALVAELLANTSFAVYQAYEQLVYVPVVIIAQRIFTAAVAIPALLLGADVVAVSALYLLGSVLALALALVLQFTRIGRTALELEPRFWPRLMAAAFPIGIATVFQVLVFRVDAAILAAFEPASVVGDYGAAFRLFEATLFISWAVTAAVYPAAARLATSSRRELGGMIDRALKLTIAATAPAALGAFILAEPIVLLLYGEDFVEGAAALRILGPAIVLYSIAFVTGGLLVAQDRQRTLVWANGIVAACSIGANLVLIPLLSLEGAAWVATGAQAALAVALLMAAPGAARDRDWRRILLGPTIATAVGAVVMTLFRHDLAPALLGGIAVFLGVLAVVERAAYPEDARAIGQFLRRRSAPAQPTA